jgi:hypothetical protein
LEASDRRGFKMDSDLADAIEEGMRDGMVRQLRQNLAICKRVIVDQDMDLKTGNVGPNPTTTHHRCSTRS